MGAEAKEKESLSRFVVGVDLGTTNSAVCCVDSRERPWRVRTLRIPQWVSADTIEARETLPSFLYQPVSGEMPRAAGAAPGAAADDSARAMVVGCYARDQGTFAPGRVIHSAKSWLCHGGVDRTAALLPWQGADDVKRLSPVEVSAHYLAHIRRAWDEQFPQHPLAQQDFVLALPASFDEIARELTVRAAALAGLPRVVLIEEPQAAFYAWIDAHRDRWEQLVQPGWKILVCDIGGGTSDFTLIRVRLGGDGLVQFHRVAVGDHLILGGDNMDLALAHHVEKKLRPRQLEPRQWAVLVGLCRQAKEQMLGPRPPASITLNLPAGGSRLIGGGIQVELSAEEVCEVLLEGFFPRVSLDERPRPRQSGFQEFGLPYAPDPAVTRYLAAFLTAHRYAGADAPAAATADSTAGVPNSFDDARRREASEAIPKSNLPSPDPARPDMVLFNGGVFESPAIRARMIETIAAWFKSPGASAAWSPIVLENPRLDLAVARGAAYYGMVRRGEGVRIAAGLARTYYIGVETGPAAGRMESPSSSSPAPAADPSPAETTTPATASPAASAEPPSESSVSATERSAETPASDTERSAESPVPAEAALCLLPAGLEPEVDVVLGDHPFELRVAEPVEFPLYVSSTRLTDRPGQLVAIDRTQITPLPPIRTVLQTRGPSGRTITVNLHAKLTEIGTLELWCQERGGRRRWRLQFDVRSTVETDRAAHAGTGEREGFIDESAWEAGRAVIAAVFGPEAGQSPDGLTKRLADALQMPRQAWPSSLCRRIWESLIEYESGRRRSPTHEARWLNLLGFALRPGYGVALDDWRVAETWKLLQGKFAHSAAHVRNEGWILWRRVAGGLSAGQQQAVAEPLLSSLRSLHRQATTGKGRSGDFTFSPGDWAELWRLLGSLELLPSAWKAELGRIALDLMPKKRWEPLRPALWWALGRLGARQPVYGPLNTVVPPETAQAWLGQILNFGGDLPEAVLAAMLIARRTDDRFRDIAAAARDSVALWLADHRAPEHFVELVRDGGRLQAAEEEQVFGEALPKGLRLPEPVN